MIMATIDDQDPRVQRLLTMIPWICRHCSRTNQTSALLWPTVKFTLICQFCGWVQNYRDDIRPIDPEPTPR
jgi:hypothetical protein